MSQLDYHRPMMTGPDRSGYLITAGILLLLCGICLGCLTAMIPVAPMLQPAGSPEMPVGQVVMSTLMYLALTIAMVWLGIGAIMRRRWSRPLTMILSVHWLITGVATVVFMIAMLPIMREQFSAPGMPAGAAVWILAISLVFLLATMVALPLTLLLLMRPAAVQQTLDHHDPVPRWTDRCSLKVLGLSLTLVVFALIILFSAPIAVAGVFGKLVTGPLASALFVLIAGAYAVSGYLAHRSDVRGIWIGLIVTVVVTASISVSALIISPVEYTKTITNDPTQIELAERHAGVYRGLTVCSVIVFGLAFVVYLLQMRKHLTQAREALTPNA